MKPAPYLLLADVLAEAARRKDEDGKLADALGWTYKTGAAVRLHVAGQDFTVFRTDRPVEDDKGGVIGQGITRELTAAQNEPARLRRAIDEMSVELEKYRRGHGAPFANERELFEKIEELENLRRELAAEGKNVPESAVALPMLSFDVPERVVARAERDLAPKGPVHYLDALGDFGGRGGLFSRGDGPLLALFTQQVKDILAGVREKRLPLALSKKTPPVYRALGLDDLPMVTTGAVIDKVHYDHGLSEAQLLMLPGLLENPVMVFDSEAEKGALVAVLDVFARGLPTVAVIRPNQKMGNYDVHIVPSAYPKDKPSAILNWWRRGLLRYVDTQKSPAWSATARLQLPGVARSSQGSGQKIVTDRDLVNKFSRGDAPAANTPAALRAELRQVRGFEAMEKAGRLAILDSAAELRAIAPGATAFDKAFITPDRKKVYLVAPNIRPGAAVGVFLHEAGVHGGLREWLGDEFQKLAEDFRKLLKAGVPAALQAEKQVQYLLDRGLMDPRHADEERVAYLVEYVTNLDAAARKSLPMRLRLFVRKVLAALRAALYASPLGPMLRRYGFELSDRDIAALARAAVARARYGENGSNPGGLAAELERAPMFYSALTRAVEGMRQPKAPGSQWAAMIQNAPGVKAEEVDWSGVLEWLQSQPGAVGKADVLAYLKENEVRVEEVEKDADARYRQWQVPGGAGYRELLLTLPAARSEVDTSGWTVSKLADDMWTVKDKDDVVIGMSEVSEAAAWDDAIGTMRGIAGASYRSRHWSEPNVLAHVRFNERTDAEGRRVLFLEEVQSDWHQTGRKQGYAAPPGKLPKGWRVERYQNAVGYDRWRVFGGWLWRG
jgi:hypothetical protein